METWCPHIDFTVQKPQDFSFWPNHCHSTANLYSWRPRSEHFSLLAQRGRKNPRRGPSRTWWIVVHWGCFWANHFFHLHQASSWCMEVQRCQLDAAAVCVAILGPSKNTGSRGAPKAASLKPIQSVVLVDTHTLRQKMFYLTKETEEAPSITSEDLYKVG